MRRRFRVCHPEVKAAARLLPRGIEANGPGSGRSVTMSANNPGGVTPNAVTPAATADAETQPLTVGWRCAARPADSRTGRIAKLL